MEDNCHYQIFMLKLTSLILYLKYYFVREFPSVVYFFYSGLKQLYYCNKLCPYRGVKVPGGFFFFFNRINPRQAHTKYTLGCVKPTAVQFCRRAGDAKSRGEPPGRISAVRTDSETNYSGHFLNPARTRTAIAECLANT